MILRVYFKDGTTCVEQVMEYQMENPTSCVERVRVAESFARSRYQKETNGAQPLRKGDGV